MRTIPHPTNDQEIRPSQSSNHPEMRDHARCYQTPLSGGLGTCTRYPQSACAACQSRAQASSGPKCKTCVVSEGCGKWGVAAAVLGGMWSDSLGLLLGNRCGKKLD